MLLGEVTSLAASVCWPPFFSLQALGNKAKSTSMSNWIKVEERQPDPGVPVIAFVTDPKNPKWSRRIRAVYAVEGTLELGEGDPWDGCTCDEESGEWFCQPGWYEQNWYEETNWRVTDTVTHWMPLPDPPSGP